MGLIENGSWAPVSGKTMQAMVGELKGMTLLEPVVTLKSALKGDSMEQLDALAGQIIATLAE